MTTALSTVESVSAPLRAGRLSAGASFALLASIVVVFMMGSSAPTPLYALYQAEWGFSPIMNTIIFGVYALAVLASLLTVGSLSDHVGRRPVLLVTVACQVVTMILFATAGSVGALVLARVVQGLSTGAAMGAIGAGMLDIDRVRGTVANSVAPMSGTGLGGFLAGLCVTFLPMPMQLVYYVLLAVLVAQGIGVWFMPETAVKRPGALASLRPHVGLPLEVRRAVYVAIPVLVSAWALAGFYGALGPLVVKTMMGSRSVLLGGCALFVLAGSGVVSTLALRDRAGHSMMVFGASALIIGLGITLVALHLRSTPLFFIATAVAGSGFGAGFQGALRHVIPLASATHRAGVLSVLFLLSYLSMGLPVVVAGFRLVYGGGDVYKISREYAVVLMLLAAVALVGALGRRPARV